MIVCGWNMSPYSIIINLQKWLSGLLLADVSDIQDKYGPWGAVIIQLQVLLLIYMSYEYLSYSQQWLSQWDLSLSL